MAAVLLAAALGIGAGGCGDSGGGRTGARETPSYATLADVPESLSLDGSTVTVGNPSALVLVHLYEDPRCPTCKAFESIGGGPVLRDWVVQGKARADYTMASFLDGRLGGHGSEKAVNALRAAFEQKKFAEYHDVLYRYQPEETVDGFTTERLLELASKVEGLRGPAFDSAVKTMKYRAFVDTAQAAYVRAGRKGGKGPGTPTLEIGGVRVPDESYNSLFDKTAFTQILTRVHEVMARETKSARA
ncbi:thioredoxin domain-containing protein [Actinomadura chibensis]|uniref:Thioredoxin domain-containing protein n=2 Tax=Actinomadura chibensis TaxID=392828 RepID=A0A5D0NIY0_9ACTN|nr:thioredoxin domain-containing protein [Actinomadura chibensis]